MALEQTGKRYTDGPLFGEPELGASPTVVVGPWQPTRPKLREIARQAVMSGRDPAEAVRKFAEGVPGITNELPGEIPPEGTPSRMPLSEGGSTVSMVSASRQIRRTEDQWTDMIGRGVVVPPPYDLWKLVATVEESDALPVLISAMATNLTGYGFEVVPLFPTKDEDTGEPLNAPAEAAAEREALDLFMASANIEHGLTGVHDKVDRDVETIGNGYLEILRDAEGKVGELQHVRGYTVRLGQLSQPIAVEQPFRHPTTGQLVTLRRWRRFRTYIQVESNQVVHFKQFGDPRFINWKTGQFALESWGLDEHGNSLDGSEILHRLIYSCHSEYGVPRWTGASPHALSGRSAGELIVSWFAGAPIGAKLAMVSGGSWSKDSYQRAVGQIDALARGKGNAWSLVVLEAESTDNMSQDMLDQTTPTPPRMGLEDLAYELPERLYSGPDNLLDGSFRRLARMFQLPPIYWGGSDDFSRAAADAARGTTEEQVFVPERKLRWLNWWNSELLPSMGINFWGVRLKGANTSDDAEDAKGIAGFVQGGGASPNMLISMWNEMRGTDAPLIAEPWGDRPLKLTELLVQNGLDPNMPLADALGDPSEGGAEGTGTPGDQPAQDTALNGAQVTAALAIVQEAVAGSISTSMARAMLVEFFNLSTEGADAILADAESIEVEPVPITNGLDEQAALGGQGITGEVDGTDQVAKGARTASSQSAGALERLLVRIAGAPERR